MTLQSPSRVVPISKVARFDHERRPAQQGGPRVVQRIARLSASEHFFVALHRFTPTNLTRVLVLEHPPTPRLIEAALRSLSARHPLLRARIFDGAHPTFVYGNAPSPVLHMVARQSDHDYRHVLERVLNTPLAHAHGPLLEAHYVYSPGTRRAELILAAEHAICDGVSMNSLCAELMELCTRALPRPALRERPVLTAMLPAFSRAEKLRSFAAALSSFAGTHVRRALHERRDVPRTTAYTFKELSRAETTSLVAQARLANTTVTGLLLAAVHNAVRAERNTAPQLSISVPINLRPRLPQQQLTADDLGNYTSAAYIETHDSDDLWENARTLKSALDEAVEDQRLLPSVGLVYRTGRAFSGAGRPTSAHAMISNSGVVPLQKEYGACRVLAFRSATSAPMLSADFAFFCNTFDDQLCINLVFSEELVSRAQAERVLLRLYQTLESSL